MEYKDIKISKMLLTQSYKISIYYSKLQSTVTLLQQFLEK